MELKEQAPGLTLARRLGDTAQVSGLAIRLHPRRTVRTDVLPHWTRFAILPGPTRDGYAPPQWLQRRE